jgi:integrase/recombinase XerC
MKDKELIGEFAYYLRYKKRLSEQTIRCYVTDLEQFCQHLTFRDEEQTAIEELALWYNENVAGSQRTATVTERKQLLAYVNRETIRQFLEHLEKEGYSRTSIIRKLAAIKSFYKMLCKQGYIETNPSSLIKAEKAQKKSRRYLDYAQIVRLIETPSTKDWLGARDRAIFEILYCTGIRINEIVELPLDSVDFVKQVINVNIKGRKRRVIPLGTSTLKALDLYLMMRKKEAEGKNFNMDMLFINKDGGALNTRSIHRKLSKYVRMAGMDEFISPNMFRHSFVAKMLKQGMDVEELREILGYQVLSKEQVCSYVIPKVDGSTDEHGLSAE